MIVRHVTASDTPAWLRLRRALWPRASEAEHASDIAAFFQGRAREPLAVLIAEDGQGNPVGFVELSIRALGRPAIVAQRKRRPTPR